MDDKQPVILCVDDESGVLSSLERSLRLEKFKVLTALSGAAGLEILKTQPVDVVISDQRMPEMTGCEFLRIVKEKHPGVIRIMLSGYSDFNSLVQAVNEGEIFRFINKPWEPADLKITIQKSLEQKRTVGLICTLLQRMQKIPQISDHVSIDSFKDDGYINVRICDTDKILSQQDINEILNSIFEIFLDNKKKDIQLLSQEVTKQNGIITFTINLDKDVVLRIDLPEKAHAA